VKRKPGINRRAGKEAGQKGLKGSRKKRYVGGAFNKAIKEKRRKK
jgi:hypothetical protein